MTTAPERLARLREFNARVRTADGLLGDAPAFFYFAHSYAAVPEDAGIIAATTDYGPPFVSAIAKDNIVGVQFHPEKSQREGLALLERFFA